MKTSLFILLPLLSLLVHGETLRIDASEFGLPEKEIRDILESTISAFPLAPNHQNTALFITRSDNGPITLHQRTPRQEIAIQLKTRSRYFAQYIYQFAHELAHVRANFQPGHHQNKWLEETLCETASLFALRELSVKWRDHPPSPTLKSYRHKLYQYAQTIIKSRVPLTPESLPAFYQQHQAHLQKSATERSLNGAIATLLLPHFEADPDRWQILASLPRTKNLSLKDYFTEWRKSAPKKHLKFLTKFESLLLGKR